MQVILIIASGTHVARLAKVTERVRYPDHVEAPKAGKHVIAPLARKTDVQAEHPLQHLACHSAVPAVPLCCHTSATHTGAALHSEQDFMLCTQAPAPLS